ncbi:uncharacterized protein BDW47DRAFT_130372 [Aspergillus candidus]|uniref:LIM zinc-binding domain-containing protein n=1 Tax=Aspergillus candidus TaxID=41067 RepID=A0A2I2FPM2_ASPCN|nr:hypothetical protein BDW47DRAFT_130372 [Aspergillus candidus]PLB42569.1 hypothetical protein BDW47DRAFT_130372 [Aspergillus candidus]
MAMAMDAGLLPTIKCSNCGLNVEIMSMGDHICPPAGFEPPPPPPKEDAWAAKVPRTGPPPRIDPAAANRPFMQVDGGMNDDSLTPAPLSTAAAQRSFTRRPLPDSPDSPDFGLGASLNDFPMPRSMSLRRPGTSDLKDANSAPPVPSLPYLNAMPTPSAAHDPPRSANLPLEEDDLPPLPVAKDHGPPMGVSHRSGPSIDSKSSYRTSFASSRYGDISDKRLTTYSSRIASFSSVAQPYRYEDVPPIPTDAIRNALHESAFSDSSMSGGSVRHDSRGDSVGSFDLGHGPDHGGERLGDRLEPDRHRPSPLRVASNPGSERSSTSRRSDELFFRSPSHSMHGAPHDLPDESDHRSKSPADTPADYRAYKAAESGHLQPNHPDSPNDPHTAQRKNSDATSDSGLSMSNFARALGLESNHTVTSSTASSDVSPSESRSGTSLSSLPSEASLSRRKPSDQGRLGPVLEELQTQGPPLGQIHESPTDLEPPKIPAGAKMAPDSPTDPALGQGSLALRREQSRETDGSLSPGPNSGIARSATEPLPGVSPTPRPKGRCKGCGETIMGKSISSKDGRLTGRYHRNCFVCFDCKVPFQTMDFYVLNDLPFCSQHYHERNGSMCQTCHQGIEGQFLETIERRGMGPVDRVRFHPDCLTCRTCNVILKGEYFEWNGLAYCERDARRAAASVSPHRFRRGGPPGRGRGLRPPPGSFDGPYGRPNSPLMPPPGARRFPERRTTRLMMI